MSEKTFYSMWIPRAGHHDIFEWRTASLPPLTEPHQVRIRIEAAGIISADINVRRGKGHPGTPPLPHIGGHEVAGIVEAIGTEVSNVYVGQRVVAIVSAGGYATHIIVEDWRCIAVADDIDPIKAVAVLVNYWTAYHCLHRTLSLQSDHKILIHGISGGVGTALLQLAALAGATVYGTASQSKHEKLAAYPATLIDYHTQDFETVIQSEHPEGIDAVFDPIGGAYWRRSYRLLKTGGHLVIYGFKGDSIRTIAPHIVEMLIRAFLPDGKSVHPVGLSPEKHRETFTKDISHLQTLLAEGKFEPIIEAVMPLKDVSSAHRMLEDGSVTGKIVLVPSH